MPIANMINKKRNRKYMSVKNVQYNNVIQTMDTEMILVRKGIARCSLKLRIYGPKCF